MSPQQFATEILHLNVWPKLAEIFDAVGSGERKVLVRSCNGAGKTTALAALCNWCLATYPDSASRSVGAKYLKPPVSTGGWDLLNG